MGPTNVALVRYFHADQEMREAQAKLDAASKDVRVQERRMNDLAERHRLAQQSLRESQSKAGQLELDLKSRDAHIEKLRKQQQDARNNKEYQTFLIEINTGKVDRNKVEDETMKLLEQVERGNQELAELATQLEAEKSKLASMKEAVHSKLATIQAEIDAIKPKVEAAGSQVPPKAREMFDRMSDRFDGEAMSAISKPDRRREEYVCTACNMDLVVDVYNKLHSRDELVFCPSCRRILYIPDDLPPEVAIKGRPASSSGAAKSGEGATKKPKKPRTPMSPLQKVLLKAAGESAQNAIAAGNDPAEFEVYIDGKLAGTFKGQSVENLQRTARYCLNEVGIAGDLVVKEKSKNAPAVEAIVTADPPANTDDTQSATDTSSSDSTVDASVSQEHAS
ncbi:hypothetical protein BH09PLA1_BH09PLA1_23210 [soil metagenome]